MASLESRWPKRIKTPHFWGFNIFLSCDSGCLASTWNWCAKGTQICQSLLIDYGPSLSRTCSITQIPICLMMLVLIILISHTHKYKIKMIYVFILPVKQRPTMEFNACQTKQQHVSIHPQMKIFKQDHLDPQHIGIPLSRGRLRSFAPLSSKLGCDGWTKFRRQLKSLTGWSLKLYFGGTHLYFGGTSLCVSSSSTCFPAIKTRRSPQLWRPTCLFESIIPALVG